MEHAAESTQPPSSPSRATLSRRTAAVVFAVPLNQSSPSASADDASFIEESPDPQVAVVEFAATTTSPTSLTPLLASL